MTTDFFLNQIAYQSILCILWNKSFQRFLTV